jgi:capsule polysaccharide modification protein KpsS
MKIIFIGHDITYAKFYNEIERELSAETFTKSFHLYFRPSAWLYAKYVLKLNTKTPAFVRIFSRWPKKNTDNSEKLDLKFYGPKHNANSRNKYQKLYNLYYEYINKIIEENEYDIAIVPGEYRIFEQSIITALNNQKKPAKILYFEAGPPGYIYFDEKGVNANASFSKTGQSNSTNCYIISKNKKTTADVNADNTKLFSTLDILWLIIAKLTRGTLDLNEYWVALKNNLIKYKTFRKKTWEYEVTTDKKNYVIFLGQVKNDVNNSHFGITELELEEKLINLLEVDSTINLMWRDHPLEDSDLIYEKLEKLFPLRIFRSPLISFDQAIIHATGIITINSNGGLEALKAGLPVRLLGESYYANLTGVHTSDESFTLGLQKIRTHGIDGAIKKDAERFLRECFMPIDYRNKDFRNSQIAAKKILSIKTDKGRK